MTRARRSWLVGMTMLVAGGCAAPITQMGSVSRDQVVIEQARQQQFALEALLKHQIRVQNVALPLLRGATPLCGNNLRPVAGYLTGNVYGWKKYDFAAAQGAGYNDTIVIMNVVPGMAAARAGLMVGDRVLAIDGVPLRVGKNAMDDLARGIFQTEGKNPRSYSLTYRRKSLTSDVRIEPDVGCSYVLRVIDDAVIQASADGQSIFINTGLLRFFPDDNELAVVIGHELAHDAMHHMDAKKKNALLGGLVGLIADVGMAAAGVNTQGEYTKQGMAAGATVFSQDFEREADYVGLYVLALAGRSIDDVPNVWRRIALVDPRSIKFASSHPTTAERFVRLEQWRGEIAHKVAAGMPLTPEMKARATALASREGVDAATNSLAPRATSQATVGEQSRKAVSLPEATPPRRTLDQPSERREPTKVVTSEKKVSIPSTGPAQARSAVDRVPSGPSAQAIIGAPSSESDRMAAVQVFEEANRYMGSHEWGKADQSFRRALAGC